MSKPKSGKSSYTSQGERRNVSRDLSNSIKRNRSGAEHMLNLQSAWKSGRDPWITIDNPNKNETNKRRIKVRMNETSLGSPKERIKHMFIMK